MNRQPSWLVMKNLTKQELDVVRQLRKVDPAVRDDFEKLLVSFIDEEERMMEFCSYHESLMDGERYMMECSASLECSLFSLHSEQVN